MFWIHINQFNNALMTEMVNVGVSKTPAVRLVGSSPTEGTIFINNM